MKMTMSREWGKMCSVEVVLDRAEHGRDFKCVVTFFFFQAEDGIRDYKVTGVQTCALPILLFYPVSYSRLAG